MQSKKLSLIEAVSNVAVGFVVSVVVQYAAFKLFGIEASIPQQLSMVSFFTVTSILRSYVLRRLFNRLL